MTGLRSFVAVPLPAPVQAEVFAAARQLAAGLPGVRWSRKVENLHVTIKFLGQVAPERLDALAGALQPALAALPRFGVDVRAVGAFPSARKAQVVWAGVTDPAQGLARVAAAVEQVAEGFGFAREQRPFRAHVTIGRCKQGLDAREALAGWEQRSFGAVDVGEVHVYESKLGGEGSTYLLRARAALGAGRLN